MKITKDILLGIVLGIAFMGSMLFLVGAVGKNTLNIDPLLGSQYPTLNVACSSDGSSVYVAAYSRVYRSRNFGKDWDIVLSDPRPASGY